MMYRYSSYWALSFAIKQMREKKGHLTLFLGHSTFWGYFANVSIIIILPKFKIFSTQIFTPQNSSYPFHAGKFYGHVVSYPSFLPISCKCYYELIKF